MSKGKKLRILRDVLGNFYESQEEQLFYCPACDHHKRKLSVNVFKCWICDFSGSSIRRLIKKFGTPASLAKWTELTDEVDVNLFTMDLFAEDKIIEKQRVPLPKEFISLANPDLPLSSRNVQLYLKKRNITKKDAIFWKMGYCDSGKYSGRVIIPSFDEDGYCNYFVARTYDNNYLKYLNPSASKDIIFNSLYLDFNSDLILVEGIFDAIISGPNSVPLLGSTLKESSLLFQEIVKNNTTIYMAMDPDASEKEDRIIKKLLSYGISVNKIDISPYNDVGEMTKEEFQKRKNESVPVEEGEEMLIKAIMAI